MNTFNKIKKTIIKDRKDKTERLIKIAQGMLKSTNRPLKKDLMFYIAHGVCIRCKKRLYVVQWEHSEERSKIKLACGCEILMHQIGEPHSGKRKNDDASIYSKIGKNEIFSMYDGKKLIKENDEIAITHMFLAAAYPKFGKVKLYDEQNSPIDTIAYHNNEKLFIQVTKLLESGFWQMLNIKGKADINDLSISKIIKLIEKAINRKLNVDSEQKKQIILLISSWPGIHEIHFSMIKEKLKKLSADSGYKEIWIVGAIPELTTQIC